MLTSWVCGTAAGTTVLPKRTQSRAEGQEEFHKVIVYCKANQDKRIIQAIDIILKEEQGQKKVMSPNRGVAASQRPPRGGLSFCITSR